MYSRREIVPDNSLLHVYFRCHDKNMFLAPDEIKYKIVVLLAKYKSKYGIKLFDFIIMDNHVHLYLWAPSSYALGNFMRTVCSQISRTINKHFNRDSQALRGRYQSRLVLSSKSSFNLVKYIYANRYTVDRSKPADKDFFCSAFWRTHMPFKKIEKPETEAQIENNLLVKLLDDYVDPFLAYHSREDGFTESLVKQANQDCEDKTDHGLFKSSHTIGTDDEIAFRTQILRSGRRDTGPPLLGVGVSSLYGDYKGSVTSSSNGIT